MIVSFLWVYDDDDASCGGVCIHDREGSAIYWLDQIEWERHNFHVLDLWVCLLFLDGMKKNQFWNKRRRKIFNFPHGLAIKIKFHRFTTFNTKRKLTFFPNNYWKLNFHVGFPFYIAFLFIAHQRSCLTPEWCTMHVGIIKEKAKL